jgi:hypothetical protein
METTENFSILLCFFQYGMKSVRHWVKDGYCRFVISSRHYTAEIRMKNITILSIMSYYEQHIEKQTADTYILM